MEAILALYQQPYHADEPVVCLDESYKRLQAEWLQPLPLRPARPSASTTGVLFLGFEPLGTWCHVWVTQQRTRLDWAQCVKQLLDEFYPQARLVHLVMDNLNTHTPAALYRAFPPQEAQRLLQRLVFHYSPKHGIWLNMAEIELSILSRQCLQRRIPSRQKLQHQVHAWATSAIACKSLFIGTLPLTMPGSNYDAFTPLFQP